MDIHLIVVSVDGADIPLHHVGSKDREGSTSQIAVNILLQLGLW
ncbi:MAG: hypothetical protein NTY30_01065 [Candidatus Berkelbacteria bacterium]|nr:hypothetical protein [Candidatus Berkelbacteria bacterium]